jgi:hypothetical protein
MDFFLAFLMCLHLTAVAICGGIWVSHFLFLLGVNRGNHIFLIDVTVFVHQSALVLTTTMFDLLQSARLGASL